MPGPYLQSGGHTARSAPFVIAVALLGCLASRGLAQDARWGAPDDSTVKLITDVETKWASSDCSPQPDLESAIADDFQGTSTDGHRYDKRAAITADPKSAARDCRLGDVRVRFFGDSVAIAYGSESRIRKADDGSQSRRCQVWTDTWLRRNGRWQIVAAQDTIVACED